MEKKEYEAMFIFNSQQSTYQETKKQVESLFKEFNIDIFDEVDMGVKKFAYEIQKQTQGHYYVYYINANGITINQMNRELKLNESLLRHMFIHLDKFGKKHYLKKKKEIGKSRNDSFHSTPEPTPETKESTEPEPVPVESTPTTEAPASPSISSENQETDKN